MKHTLNTLLAMELASGMKHTLNTPLAMELVVYETYTKYTTSNGASTMN